MLVTVLTVVLVLISLAVIAVVLLQSGRSAGLSGAIAGGAEQVFGKRRGLDEFLSKLTIVLAILFAIIAVVVTYLER